MLTKIARSDMLRVFKCQYCGNAYYICEISKVLCMIWLDGKVLHNGIEICAEMCEAKKSLHKGFHAKCIFDKKTPNILLRFNILAKNHQSDV